MKPGNETLCKRKRLFVSKTNPQRTKKKLKENNRQINISSDEDVLITFFLMKLAKLSMISVYKLEYKPTNSSHDSKKELTCITSVKAPQNMQDFGEF